MREFLKKIQQWPRKRKKILLWMTIIILGIFLFRFYIGNLQKKFQALRQNEKREILKKRGNEWQKIEEELKKLEKELEDLYKAFQPKKNENVK